jgi:hypothetical protein
MDRQQFLALHYGKSRGLGDDIYPKWHYRTPFKAKLVATTLILSPKNVRQRSVNNFWPCIIENSRAVQQGESIIALSATILGKTCCDNIASMS